MIHREQMQNSKNIACSVCSKTVYPTEKITLGNLIIHKACFKCGFCGVSLTMQNSATLNGHLYCKVHLPKPTKVTNSPQQQAQQRQQLEHPPQVQQVLKQQQQQQVQQVSERKMELLPVSGANFKSLDVIAEKDDKDKPISTTSESPTAANSASASASATDSNNQSKPSVSETIAAAVAASNEGKVAAASAAKETAATNAKINQKDTGASTTNSNLKSNSSNGNGNDNQCLSCENLKFQNKALLAKQSELEKRLEILERQLRRKERSKTNIFTSCFPNKIMPQAKIDRQPDQPNTNMNIMY